MIKPNNLFQRLAGNLPGVLLWLTVLPLAALGQANYATPYTFITIAGKAGAAGSADGTNGAARFNGPIGVAVDTNGSVYVPEFGNNTIRRVTPVGTSWVVTTVAGLAGHPGSADGTNSAARFNFTINVGGLNYIGCGPAVDSAGNVYVPDAGNNTIRKITPDGTNWVVTTVAGLAGSPGSADGTGSTARFNFGAGSGGAVAMDSAGNLYVPDWGNNTIREGMPASSVLPPILQPPSLNAGLFGFGITGLPGLSVNIESSTNLSSWQLITTFVLVGGTNYYSASPNPAQGAQFYHAHVR
jgi:hypothetical protein